MDAYIYQADLLCETCGVATAADLDERHVEDTGDSDDYPQGPYADGGGEADTPQFCHDCAVFLENPLTTEGYAYVTGLVRSGKGDAEFLNTMADFYDIDVYEGEEDSFALTDCINWNKNPNGDCAGRMIRCTNDTIMCEACYNKNG